MSLTKARGAPRAPTTLLIVRHAETADNVEVRLSGWTDADLTARGEAQVNLLADHFNRAHRHAAALYSSPLTRARRTADAIGTLTGHGPILLDDLREMHFGELEGRPFEEIKQIYGHLMRANESAEVEDFAWPNGESRLGFRRRVQRVMNRIAIAHPGQAVGVITHGGVISTFLTIVHGEPSGSWRKWGVDNASLTEVLWDGAHETGTLLRHGDAAHLSQLAAEETG